MPTEVSEQSGVSAADEELNSESSSNSQENSVSLVADISQATTSATQESTDSQTPVASQAEQANEQTANDDAAVVSKAKSTPEKSAEFYGTPIDYVEKKQDGYWYLYDPKTGTPYTGFQKLADDRIVYYNEKGQMQYGWQWIDNATHYFDTFDGKMAIGQQKIATHWYLFNEKGEMQRGFQNIPDEDKTVYYNQDGWMLYGWQWINNATYYFDTFNGKMATDQQKINDHWYLFTEEGEMLRGFQNIPSENKMVYYNQDGWMLYGWQRINNATYYFDTFNGKMATGQQKINGHWYLFNEKGEMQQGFQYIPSEDKTVYYAENGQMLYGQQKINGYWYNFDTFNGAMKTGFVQIPDQNKTVYYNEKGQMQYGWQWIDNATHYFDTFDGKMAVGQQNINGHWYLFNEQGEMQRGFQYIASQNKTVYYNENGWMLYGVQQIDQNKYHFDVITGAMTVNNVAYDQATGKLNYYDKEGKQIAGVITLGGKEYNFANGDLTVNGQQMVTINGQTYLLNGSQVVTGQQKINNNWYYFDETTGAMIRGFKYIASQNKTVYYAENGQMLYGQQKINGYWYNFDTFNGAMKTGFVQIPDQNKTVYYDGNGQMVYGFRDINGRRYFFDRVTGAQASSEILWIDGSAYAFDSQGGAHSFSELAQLVNQLGSNIAVAIQSQKSGQIYSYSNSGNMRFKTASTVKVAVLAELLHNTGGNLTAYQRSLAENMIRNSDNNATTELIKNHLHESSNNLSIYRDLGMTNTTPAPSWGATLTTPTDQLKLLYQIFMTNNSSYLNQKSQSYLKELMHTINVNQRWGISAGSSDYYLKNGWVTYGGPWYINSIGFIPDNGHGYTIAVYSYNNTYSTGINKVEQVARKVSQMLK